MLLGRIRQPDRAPSAVPVSSTSLAGYSLNFHKRSVRDGSGKCNIVETRITGDVVHGVLYEISGGNREALDLAEGYKRGYVRKEVEVLAAGGWLPAFTYVAQNNYVDQSLYPYHWYKEFVVAGAFEHALPEDYVEELRLVMSRADPDANRDEAARMILAIATAGHAGAHRSLVPEQILRAR